MVSKVSHRLSHSLLWPPESVHVIKFTIFLHLLKKTYFLASVLKGKSRIQRKHEVKMPNKNSKGAFLIHLLMMMKKFAHVIPTNICFCELFVLNYKEKEENMQNNKLMTPKISALCHFSRKQIFLPILWIWHLLTLENAEISSSNIISNGSSFWDMAIMIQFGF